MNISFSFNRASCCKEDEIFIGPLLRWSGSRVVNGIVHTYAFNSYIYVCECVLAWLRDEEKRAGKSWRKHRRRASLWTLKPLAYRCYFLLVGPFGEPEFRPGLVCVHPRSTVTAFFIIATFSTSEHSHDSVFSSLTQCQCLVESF